MIQHSLFYKNMGKEQRSATPYIFIRQAFFQRLIS